MAAVVEELDGSGVTEITASGTQIVRMFNVTDADGLSQYEAATAVGVPQIGDVNPDVNIPVLRISTEFVSRKLVVVSVTYSNASSGGGATGTDELDESYEVYEESRTVYEDPETELPIGDGGEGVDVPYPVGNYSYGADISPQDLRDMEGVIGRVNSSAFVGRATGTMRFNGISVVRVIAPGLIRVRLSFLVDPAGWGRQQRNADGEVVSVGVYKTANLSSIMPPVTS